MHAWQYLVEFIKSDSATCSMAPRANYAVSKNMN